MPENEGQARDPAHFKKGAIKASKASAIPHSVPPLPCTYMHIYIYIYVFHHSTPSPTPPVPKEASSYSPPALLFRRIRDIRVALVIMVLSELFAT